jgi:hypothetical protein
VEFSQAEIIFYAVASIASGAACFARVLRDHEPVEFSTLVGRCMSSAVLGFGVVALWLGNSPVADGTNGFFWLAIASLIGYCSRDIQDQIIQRLVDWILKKFDSDGK